jgi:hypothetical protein
MAHSQFSAPPQPPSQRSALMLWVGVMFLLAIAIAGIAALVMKQNLIFSVISFIVAFLSLPIGILQIAPGILPQMRQTIKTGLLLSIIVVLMGSLALNGFLLLHPHASTPPPNPPSPSQSGRMPTPTPTPTLTSQPIPILVQENFSVQNQPTSSNTLTFPKRVRAGDLIIVAITNFLRSISSVTDNQDDTYIQVAAAQHANNHTDYVLLYYAKNVAAGQTTITAQGGGNMGIYEYSGLDPLSPLDQVASNAGMGNTPNGGIVNTTKDNELYFVVGVDDNGGNTSLSAGNGYILRDVEADSTHHERFYTEDRVAAHGSYSTDFTIAVGSHWAVIGATFKP